MRQILARRPSNPTKTLVSAGCVIFRVRARSIDGSLLSYRAAVSGASSEPRRGSGDIGGYDGGLCNVTLECYEEAGAQQSAGVQKARLW